MKADLIYLRARYYDPQLGRFINEDPIKDGLNWYVYCNNNPVNFVDPSGEFAAEAAIIYGTGKLFSYALAIVAGLITGSLISDGIRRGTVSEPDTPVSEPQVVPQPHDGSNVDITVQPNVDPKINTVTYEQDADYENAKNKGEPAPNHNIVEGAKGKNDSLGTTGEPNSSTDLHDEDGLKQRRYYGPDGKAEKDIDYKHGGANHKFPHEHTWDWSSKYPQRIP